ncbi:alpha/beta fold hydrolase [Pararoseomonas indoligenes]|uniref:Alpha/beta fold hydrolase n=1 Tax=Roseomonas indoligenes TaxID=2820811 RepID=A0A940MZ27_9PROT|nr:alpha/beta fold hydrolase [Pararoseomonas indoligenes]MBP0493081.1 alpha/beta fold hydrolase [Pararoseomonas indoligenes]
MILNAVEAGEGPVLVLLHGLFGQARNFGVLQRRLAAGGRRVVALDMPNHGASPHAAAMDYRLMADAVAKTLAAMGIPRAAVMGHSMGGKAAMMLALTRPELVARLLVADIAPVSYPSRWVPLVEAMRGVPPGMPRAEVDAALASAEPDAGVRAFILTNRKPDASGWRIGLEEISATLPAIMGWEAPDNATFDGPTLVVAGEHSRYIRTENRPTFRALFPHARFLTLKGASHWLHADQPDAFAAVVEGFAPV